MPSRDKTKKAAWQRAYYARHRAEIQCRDRERNIIRRQPKLAYNRKYYEEKREAVLSQKRSYYIANREAIRARTDKPRRKLRDAKRYIEQRESMLARSIEWLRLHPERRRQYKAAERLAHPERQRQLEAIRRAAKLGASVGDLTEIAAWLKAWQSETIVTCYWCSGKFPPRSCHQDHVEPLSKGGYHSIENLVISCASCNHRKGNKTPQQWNLRLREPQLLYA